MTFNVKPITDSTQLELDFDHSLDSSEVFRLRIDHSGGAAILMEVTPTRINMFEINPDSYVLADAVQKYIESFADSFGFKSDIESLNASSRCMKDPDLFVVGDAKFHGMDILNRDFYIHLLIPMLRDLGYKVEELQ